MSKVIMAAIELSKIMFQCHLDCLIQNVSDKITTTGRIFAKPLKNTVDVPFSTFNQNNGYIHTYSNLLPGTPCQVFFIFKSVLTCVLAGVTDGGTKTYFAVLPSGVVPVAIKAVVPP